MHARFPFPSATLRRFLATVPYSDRQSLAVRRQRGELIAARIRVIASLLAVLTLAWIAVDACVFEPALSLNLAIGRVAAGAGFALLALSAAPSPSRGTPLAALLLLVSIPLGFAVIAASLIGDAANGGMPGILRSAYVHLPFVIAIGLALFPLTAIEGAILSSPILAVGALFASTPSIAAGSAFDFGHLWLLLLMSGTAAASAICQYRFLAALVDRSSRDELTGAMTRRFGEELLAFQVEVARRQRGPLALAFLDMDRFKSINDRFGHDTGDAVLSVATASLRRVLRRQDLAIRWGGEEFVIMLPATDAKGAARMIERLAELGLGQLPDGTRVSASFGIAELTLDQAASWSELVALADRRMYRAKQAGRNRVSDPFGAVTEFLRQPAPPAEGAPRAAA